MEKLDFIFKRMSVRKFQCRDVDDKTVSLILEAGNAAPSARNLQARDFVVVRDKKTKEALSRAAGGQTSIVEAPVVIISCANHTRSKDQGAHGRFCAEIDAAVAAENMFLAASSLGLGAVWIGGFDEKEVASLLSIPVRPIAILPIGYPAEEPTKKERYPIETLTHHEKW
jgi:nitroreductase